MEGGRPGRDRSAEVAKAGDDYIGGGSQHWRPFLDELANHPGQWISWDHLCEAIGLSKKQASGMLGAAERRCKQRPPYDKTLDEGVHWFRMQPDVADALRPLRAPNV